MKRRLHKKIFRFLNTNISFILGGLMSIAIIGSLLVYAIEPESFTTPWDALWWAVVTITTVGYGDIVPDSAMTRIIAVLVMLSGISFMSLFTASISTGFITRKIREGKGLEKVTLREHIVICGWNEHSQNLLDSLNSLNGDREEMPIALVNTISEDDMDNVISKYPQLLIKFVKGDHTKQPILEKANISQARAVILLPNESPDSKDPDEKTVLATLSIKSMNPDTSH